MAPLINKEIDSFLGGVSQQPPETRLDSQVEESLNSLLDTTSGAMKRPPLLHKANLNSTEMRETKTHIIDRDENENYIVNMEAGTAALYNTDMTILDASTGQEQMLINIDKDEAREYSAMSLEGWSGGDTTGNPIWIRTREKIGTIGLTSGDEVTLNGTGSAPGAIATDPSGTSLDGVTFEIDIINGDYLFSLLNSTGIPGPGNVNDNPFYGPNPRITHIGGLEPHKDFIYTPSEAYIKDIGTPNKSIRMLTIADTTFVVNRLKTVTMSGSPPAVPNDRAIISCSGGGALSNDGKDLEETELTGYDADDPKTLDGPRWRIRIDDLSYGPTTKSNDEISSDQIYVIWQALQPTFTDTLGAVWAGLADAGPINTDGDPADIGEDEFFDHHDHNTKGSGVSFAEADGTGVENFAGMNGWTWTYPGIAHDIPLATAGGGAATPVVPLRSSGNFILPNWILGEYDKDDNLNPWDTTAEIPVTHPDRERLDFTLGSPNISVIHNFSGPADVSKLPATCLDGFVTKIVGDAEVEADEYYLKFSEKDGAWIESIAESTTEREPLDSSFDVSTMPHVLKRRVATGGQAGGPPEEIDHGLGLNEGDIYFTFGPEDWASRTVGDEVMSPEPSFVGQTLNDVVLYKDRLTLLSRDSAVFSEVREPLNFWPTSIMSFVDSDPIDVQAATTTDGVSNFHSGVATEAGLLLFTDSGQFLARSGYQDPFTSRTVHIDQISRYQSENISKPAFIGSRVYWVTEQGVNSKVWEYIVTSASGGGSFAGSATEITGHVPRYLPPNIYKITGNDNESIVCFFSRDEPNNIYVYQYLFSGQNRLQSAWSKWTFDQEIVNAGFIDRNLHLLMNRTDAHNGDLTTLEYLPPRMSDPDLTDSPITDMPVYLDHRVKVTPAATNPSSQGLGSHTEVVLPYLVPRDPADATKVHPDIQVLVGGSGSNAGSLIVRGTDKLTVNNTFPNSIFITGDEYDQIPLFVGKKYEQDITLSRFVIKTTDRTRTVKPYTSGRTQIRTFTIRFSMAGPFTIYVDNGGTIYSYDYDPWVLGDLLGPKLSSNESFKVDVGGQNTETDVRIVNDSPFISNFIGAIYEASWNTRSKRI